MGGALSAVATTERSDWDISTGEELACLNGHELDLASRFFSDGRRIASSGWDDWTVRVWDTKRKNALTLSTVLGMLPQSPQGVAVSLASLSRREHSHRIVSGR
jgi:WD40 repeat protein